MDDCEKVSVRCGAAEHGDVENFCAACNEGTGFECATHERDWYDCNIKEANRLTAQVGLRHANMQDALATAYAKATGKTKDSVLEELRELERLQR